MAITAIAVRACVNFVHGDKVHSKVQSNLRKKSVVFCCAVSLAIPLTLCSAENAPSAKRKHPVAQKTNQAASPNHIHELEDQVSQQKALIEQQRQRLEKLEQLIQQTNTRQTQTEEALRATMQRNADQTAEVEKTAATLNNTVSTLKATVVANDNSVKETQKALKSMDQPTSIKYKGLSLTPGGFIEADVFERSHNENADITANFGAVPFDGVVNAKLREFRATSRATRFSLLTETMVNNTRLNGYYEIDFLAQAPTSNQVQTNSFVPRQRQLWIQASMPSGLTFTAGQFWSLITTHRQGLATRSEFIPTVVEASYVVGYDYVRQTSFRVTKNFHNKTWAAVEVANAETNQPNASYVPDNLFGFNNSANAASPNGSTLNFLSGNTNGFSTNLAPDLLAKVAWEPGWGHYELKALGRFFRDRINGKNNYSYGGGLGAAAILPVVNRKVDFIAEALAGEGIGRYGAANGSDVTLRPDGKIIPIHALHVLTGIEIHPVPRMDIFAYGGDEYYGRAAYLNPTDHNKPAGYGSPLVNNTNCELEVVPTGAAACGAQNKNLWHSTSGVWYRFYRGPGGTLQYGFQYEYIRRATWSGIGGAPQGGMSNFLTAVRYILP